jgi:hypothetical protein
LKTSSIQAEQDCQGGVLDALDRTLSALVGGFCGKPLGQQSALKFRGQRIGEALPRWKVLQDHELPGLAIMGGRRLHCRLQEAG